jgi:hypothetical protein
MAEPLTLFDHITSSVEVLAEKLVYMKLIPMSGNIKKVFRSTIFDERMFWFTEIEAIAATVARLKEVCDGN